ncbi:MAG TPA: multidrug efflux SMR transporter [Methanomassiliicoccales archaeon]|nr:multidrug efflux SMR transporter [Methanomassiliicoccales archaeon]
MALAMPSLAWTYLIIAGLMEPCWVIGLKRSEGLKRLGWSAVTIGFVLASMYFLASAMAMGLPMGTAYAVWTGIGAVGALVAGAVLFKERTELVRVFFVLLIIVGIAGVQMTSGA